MQSRPSRWPWLLAIPVVIGAGWWLFRGTVEAPNAASAPKPTAVAAAAPTPPAPAAPSAPQHPLPAHPADAADAAIPPLAKSDSAAWEALHALVPDEAARELLGIAPDVAAFAIDRLGLAGARAVEWRHTLVRGDRFSVTARFSPAEGYRMG